jgi:hypothetical protein
MYDARSASAFALGKENMKGSYLINFFSYRSQQFSKGELG